MPDISGVQILQGPLELGKDLVFYIRGAFGESLLCACVVKNSRISGDAGKAEGARTVYQQAQQAFDSPHVDSSGRDLPVERVYIVTPFDLSPSTMTSIRGRLSDRAGQVVFIGGPVLFDLFRKYWPDYFADEANVIERHLKQVLKGFEDNNPLLGIATTYNVGSGQLNSKKVYVPQLFFRELHSYSAGITLTKVFPFPEELESPLSLFDVEQITARSLRFSRALSFLEMWGYCSPNKQGRGKGKISLIIEQFNEMLVSDWRREVKLEHGTLARLGSVRSKVGRPEKLTKLLSQLVSQKDEALSDLTTELSNLDAVVASKVQRNIGSLADDGYLSASALDSCAHAAPERVFVTKESARIGFPKNILDKWEGHLLIVGAAGFGKTSFCRWHALKDAERFNSGKSSVIPVYVPLHRLADRNARSFSKAFLGTLGKSALLAGATSGKEASREKVRLYLDGLDEIPLATRRQEIINLARNTTRRESKYQVIVTSRDYIHEPYLNWLPRIALGGFDDADISALVGQWLGRNSEERVQFYDQLHEVPALQGLMHIPLLATLIILVFRQTRRLPESRTRLYEVFISLLSGGWDMAKRILRPSRFGQRVKLIVLRVLAAHLHERQGREFGQHEITSAIKMSRSESVVPDWELLRNEFLEDGLISSGGNILQFSHLSFQEFLTAQNYIGDLNPARINRALELFIAGSDWWKEVVIFYVGLSGKPREMATWLRSAMNNTRRPIGVARHDAIIKGVKESYPEFPIEKMIGNG
jgi:hypothetical protein